MINKITIGLWISFCWLFCACTNETFVADESVVEEAEGPYFKLTVHCPEANDPGMQTRSNPTGGENGDGHEAGQDYETYIEDIMLLFYQGTNGVNSPASTSIKKIMYFSRADMIDDGETEPVRVGLPGGEYDLLVITNTGDLRSQLQGKNLGEVRDYLQKTAWTEQQGKYSRFVMSSNGHTEDKVTLCGENYRAETPATAVVEVERHAARIDMQLKYDLYDVNDETSGKAYAVVTGALIVNKLNAGSYMLKRVQASNATTGGYALANTREYLGLELPEFGDHQINYVIDPWSFQKTIVNIDRNVFNPTAPGEGSSSLSSLYANYLTSYGTSTKNWPFEPGFGEKIGDWYRIGYTLENAVENDEQSRFINTGVVFKAAYVPENYLVYDTEGKVTGAKPTGAEEAFTFFAYEGKIYQTAEAVMAAFMPKGVNYLFNYSFAGFTWANVQHYIEGIPDNDPTGYKNYLLRQLGGKVLTATLTTAEAEALSWETFMWKEYGYSYDNGVLKVNQNNKDTRRLLARYGLHTYVDGVCYYPYWIRHSNNNDDTKGIMEYAIVRNNIYKLRLNGIYGLGYDIPYEPPFEEEPEPEDPVDPTPPTPTPDPEPEPDPQLIQVEVVVKNWVELSKETIIF